MNAIELLIDLARRPQAAAEELRGMLTAELLNAHPHHDNSIAWLLWHSAREIDEQLSHISGRDTVWIAGGFEERFGLSTEANEHGYGHTPEQARAIVVRDPALLIDHLAAVIDAQVGYLSTLVEGDLSRIVDASRTPPVSVGTRMVSMSVDAAEHLAQATYIAGMGSASFEGR